MCSGCDCENKAVCPGNCPTSCDFTVVVTTKERGNTIDYPFHYDKVLYVEDYGGAGLDYRTWNDAIEEAEGFIISHAMFDLKSNMHGA